MIYFPGQGDLDEIEEVYGNKYSLRNEGSLFCHDHGIKENISSGKKNSFLWIRDTVL